MVILLAVIYTMLSPAQTVEQLSYSDVVDMFRNEEVESFTVEGSSLIIHPRGAAEGEPDISYELYDVGLFWNHLGALIDEQHEAGIIKDYEFDHGFVAPWWLSMIPYLLIIFGFFALWYYMMSKAGGGSGGRADGRRGRPQARPCPAAGRTWQRP